MKNRLLSGFLATTMLFSMLPSTVFATGEITTSGGTNDVPAKVTQDATTFSVTVPTSLPVHVDSDGEVTVATDNKIINNSYGPVEVKSIEVQPKNDWTLVDFTTDFSSKKVGLKQFGFQVNDANVLTDGSCDAEFNIIPGNSQLGFTYDSVVAMQKSALSDEQIASVVFTVGWADSAAEDTGPSGYEITPVSELDTYEDTDGNVSLILDNGESADLSAIATYSMEAPTWASSNPSVLTISDEGVMTAVAPGYAEITYGTSRVSETIGVWVSETFELTNSDYDLIDYTEGDTKLIIPKYVMNDTQLKKITSIAANTFTNHNNITSIELPESIIDIGDNAFDGCTSIENVDYQGSAEQWEEIRIGNSNHDLVNKTDYAVALTGISLNKTSMTLNKGSTSTLTVTYNPSNTTEDKTVIWSSSDESVATVSSSGKVTAIDIGTATITAKVGSYSKTCTVTVNISLQEISLNNSLLFLDEGETETLTVSYNPSNTTDSKNVTWYSSNPSIATVDTNGKVTAVSEGIATITAKVGSHKATCTVDIGSIHLKDSLTLYVGDTYDLELIIEDDGHLKYLGLGDNYLGLLSPHSWDSSDTSVISLTNYNNKAKRLTAVSPGTATITVQGLGYTKTCNVNVLDIKPGLYDADGVKLCSYAESGLYAHTNYLLEDDFEALLNNGMVYNVNPHSGYSVLTNNYPTTTKVVLPTTTKGIGDFAFYDCYNTPLSGLNRGNLTSIVIPDSVTSIGRGAFGSCDNLETIYYTGTEEQWHAISKEIKWDAYAGANTDAGTYTVVFNYKG